MKMKTKFIVLMVLALGCFGLLPTPKAFGVLPAPDGSYPNQNTAKGDDAVFSPNAPIASLIWRPTGSLTFARDGHTAALLPNGMVLVAGGFGGHNILASAELYDPASRTWAATGSLNTARTNHTATLLQNGMVLVAGGQRTDNRVLASAEVGRREP